MKNNIAYIIIGVLLAVIGYGVYSFINLEKVVAQDNVTLTQVVSFINQSIQAGQKAVTK